jgi:hypothetical protein
MTNKTSAILFDIIGALLIILLTLLLFAMTMYARQIQASKRKGKIIRQTTDERGLTSVIFIEYNHVKVSRTILVDSVITDTVGLDYLNKHELDSLKKSFTP